MTGLAIDLTEMTSDADLLFAVNPLHLDTPSSSKTSLRETRWGVAVASFRTQTIPYSIWQSQFQGLTYDGHQAAKRPLVIATSEVPYRSCSVAVFVSAFICRTWR